MKLSYSKAFHNTLNYASTANIEEVMKFYNLDHKTFETDFSRQFFFVITTTESTSCLVEIFQLIYYLQQVNTAWQYKDSCSTNF